MTQCDIEGRRTLSSHLLASRHAAVLVRLRLHVQLRRCDARRGGVRAQGCGPGVPTFSPGPDLHGIARNQGLAVQRAAGARQVHVARPRATLRQVRAPLAPSHRLSPQQRPRRSRRPQLARRAIFLASFAEDLDISDAGVLRKLVDSAGGDGERAVELAQTPEIKARLRANTAEAQRIGIFGAPDFVIDGELFFGQDRLEDAVAWASRR